MNKKRLSVVMAGAMLASSVAPVLAATETEKVEISSADKGTLIKELTDLLWTSPKYSNDIRNKGIVGNRVYDVKVNSILINLSTADTQAKVEDAVRTAVNAANVGEKIEIINNGFREVKEGEKTLIIGTETQTKYTQAQLEGSTDVTGSILNQIDKFYKDKSGVGTKFFTIVESATYVSGKGFVFTFKDAAKDVYGKELVITTDTELMDFTKYYSDDNFTEESFSASLPAAETDFYGFAKAAANVNTLIGATVEKEYTLTAGGTSVTIDDLYDGVMLKDKGQELLSLAKDAQAAIGKQSGAAEADKAEFAVKATDLNNAQLITPTDKIDGTGTYKAITDKKGEYKVKVEIANPFSVTAKNTVGSYFTYTITGKDKAAIERVVKWLHTGHANVDELIGEDRYATAVKIAKELADIKTVADGEDIVLVNGDSLVDGLAAAPLAEHLGTGKTPILLTENNKLPKATKAYLKELIDVAHNNKVTVNIVGGDGVVSNSVVKELKDMNLKVKRYAGEDREATSMAVAEVVGTTNGAFVVGATGEADAMSVSGYAADKKMPIIVSGFNGLSEDTINTLTGEEVTVVGGDSAVSESDYNAVKAVADKVRRLHGSDRKATNAAVINTLYTSDFASTPEAVIVAKDDVLIDALTAANLSAKGHAPIVLATKELSKEQINAIVMNANTAKNIYQVGGGVLRDVVKAIAVSLNLA